jgi:cytochrome c heme-lyase
MFFNSLKRKNKLDNIYENDIENVLKIHNGTNERTWETVMEWEKKHLTVCDNPTLLKFNGKPDALSIKKFFKKYILRMNHFVNL